MQDWFEYEFGYVNIDDDAIYLTNTGNWTEIIRVKEKVMIRSMTNFLRRLSFVFFYGSFCLLTIAFIFLAIERQSLPAFVFAAFMVFGAYHLYKYLQHDMGARFRIPHGKIISMMVMDKEIVILFINGHGKEDSCKLTSPSQKGIDLIYKMKAA